jgi:Tol biopolymer transport system component
MNPAWTPDGREIIVASGEFENSRLFRVPVSGSGSASVIASAGDSATLPANAPDGRLAFTRTRSNRSIWTLDLATVPNTRSRLRRWPASSNLTDSNPRFSADGRRVAFVSTRSGTYQIWIANADGSGAFQLTSVPLPFVGSPNWSPDGSTILFCGTKDGHFEVYATTAAGGTPRRLISSSGQDAVASFSRDGRWIYFTSNRTGEFQIWRMPAKGGEAVQLTRGGGRVARESTDGRYVYFATLPRDGRCTLRRMSPAGGEETQILESVWPFAWDLTNSGIYYEDLPGLDGLRTIYFYSFATGRIAQVSDARLRGGEGLTISPNGTTLLHDEFAETTADIMVLENFR